jgi:mono/diheme cytochrome c family protein
MNNQPTNMSRLARTTVCAASALLLASGLTACRGERSDKPPRQFLPDMDDSPKFKPQSEAPFFLDGRSMRRPVAGTVPFGYTMDPDAPSRGWSVADDPAVFEGIDASKPKDAETGRPAYQPVVPEAVFERMLADAAADGRSMSRTELVSHMLDRGQERFDIYCSACHGYQGEGGGEINGIGYGGLVGQRWGYAVPSYHDAKYKDRAVYTGQDGYLFNVIRHGVPNTVEGAPPKMPGYADKISVADSWSIVLYLRALQATRAEGMDGVPAEERIKLEQRRPPASRSQIDPAPAGPAVASTETNP